MAWLPLTSDDDIATFIANVQGFHDAYLRVAHVDFGSGDPSASPYEDARQRAVGRLAIDTPDGPHGGMRLVELRFDEVVACHVRPSGPLFDPTILEAEIVRRNDFYWCLNELLIGGTDSTWIGGRRLFWREARVGA